MKHVIVFVIIISTLISCNENTQENRADSLQEYALKAMEAKEFTSAIDSAKKALETYTDISDTIGIIESNYLIARSSALSSDFNNAVLYGEAGSDLCKIITNYLLEYKINNVLSWAYFTLGKGFDETLEHQKRQLFVVKQLDDDNAKAMVYNNYGYDATTSGSVPIIEAIEYMTFANDHYAKTEKNNGRWYTLMNLTWQHRLINDLMKSEEYGRMAVEQAEVDNDRHAIIEANSNLGETLLLQNKMEEAKLLYERGLELSKERADRDKYVFDVYYSRYLWNTNKQDSAISTLKAAITFLEKNEIFYEMLGRAFLADFSYSINDISEAKKQVSIFANPRANYFSQESSVIASTIEAQIMAGEDQEKALEILENKLLEVDISGAQLLKMEISDLVENIN